MHILTIKTEGNKVTGTAKYGRADSPLVDGRLDGDVITFSVRYQAVNGIVQSTFQGTVHDDAMDLTMTGPSGPTSVTARKMK